MAYGNIDLNKPTRLYPDSGLHKSDMLYIKDILFSNDKVCLCTVMFDNKETFDDNMMLFDLKTGKVLTLNAHWGSYYAENY